MTQSLIPVDGQKEPPQICVIEASVGLWLQILSAPVCLFKHRLFLQLARQGGRGGMIGGEYRWVTSRGQHWFHTHLVKRLVVGVDFPVFLKVNVWVPWP